MSDTPHDVPARTTIVLESNVTRGGLLIVVGDSLPAVAVAGVTLLLQRSYFSSFWAGPAVGMRRVRC